MKIGYTIHDKGECRSAEGDPPKIGDLTVCFRQAITVTKITERASPPRGFDKWYDVSTKD